MRLAASAERGGVRSDRVSVTMKRARPTVNAWAIGPSGPAPGTPAGTADNGIG